MRYIRTCNDCINRFLCPTRKISKPNDICTGYNNEEVFRSLLSLDFLLDRDLISERLDFIKKLQDEE